MKKIGEYQKYMKQWKADNYDCYKENKKRYELRYPDRAYFTKRLCVLVRNKKVKRGTKCVICGSTSMVQGSTLSSDIKHPIWLCYEHNRYLHRKVRELSSGVVDPRVRL